MWRAVTMAADGFLDTLTTDTPQSALLPNGNSAEWTLRSALCRVTYHYWYHIGEIQTLRQTLGNKDLPKCVGDIETETPYRLE